MIKTYTQFIKESNFGDYVEKHMENDDIKRMILPYLSKYNIDLKIPNIVELLDNSQKEEISNIIKNYIENGLTPKDEKEVSVIGVIEESSGKGVFTSFLKAISALNHKNFKKKEKESFLIYFESSLLDFEQIKTIFERFKSLLFYLNDINESKEKLVLYFGLNYDMNIEYGLIINDKSFTFGYFTLSNSTLKWMVDLNLKSSAIYKQDFSSLDINSFKLFNKIRKDIKSLSITDYKKATHPIISSNTLKWGYYGIGTWKNGTMEESDLVEFKEKIKNWIIGNKWGDKVLYKVQPHDFWLVVEIKIK